MVSSSSGKRISLSMVVLNSGTGGSSTKGRFERSGSCLRMILSETGTRALRRAEWEMLPETMMERFEPV